MISWENYEEYMMMHADGELEPAQVSELMEFVNQNPELKAELADLQMVRLVPDTTMVYANKEALLKTEPAKKVIAFPAWKRYSIAAAVAAILFLSLYRFTGDSNDNNNSGEVAVKDNVGNKPTEHKVAVPVAVPQTNNTTNNAIAQNSPAIAVKHEPPVVKHEQVRKEAVQVAHQDSKQLVVAERIGELPATRPQENIAAVEQLPVNSVKEIPAAPTAYAVADVPAVPEYAAPVQEEKRTLWDRLPVDDAKKKKMENIAGAIKDATSDPKLSIKVEKKKLVLSF